MAAYTLYWSPGAASLALHWMLIELGADFEAVRVDIDSGANKRPEYLAINPQGLIPTLVVDGAVHVEAAAMLMLIAERHPEAGLSPAPGSPHRADYLQLMFHFANGLQPPFRSWFYPNELAGEANAEAVKASTRVRIEAMWDRLDRRLSDGRPYLLGDVLTAADFLGTMLTRWSRNMPKPATQWPHLKTYIDRMRAMASLKEVHTREGLTDWIGG